MRIVRAPALSEEVHRRRSEARFGSLVQHSSDLITVLGPECFYDHEHHTLPTRRPVLDALGQPLH